MVPEARATLTLIYFSFFSSCDCLLPTTVAKPKDLSLRDTLFMKWQWHWLLYIILAWEIRRVLLIFLYRSPKRVTIVGLPSVLGSWLTSILYMFDAQRIVKTAYEQANGKPYAIPARDRYHICVSTQKQIEELNNASIHRLSLKAAIFDRVFPEQTIDGLQIQDSDPNGSVGQNVFKFRLRSYLPSLRPILQQRLDESFKKDLVGEKNQEGWTRVSAQSVISRLAVRMNSLIIVGEHLSNQPEYLEAVIQYLHDATMTEEILQFTPKALFPVVTFLIMGWSGAQKKVVDFLHSMVLERLSNQISDDQKPTDGIQWTIESSRNNSPRAIVRQLLAFVFGSAHQMPMLIVFALYNLCVHPEYIAPLREEIARAADDEFNGQNEDMPLLDSFLKETARLNPIIIIGVPRKVLSPFTFSDGVYIPSGNWVCVPQQALMQDPTIYPDPMTFDGFRFANDKNGNATSDSRFSHPSWRFPFWGSVKQACPARFWVSMAAKMVLIQFLNRYEFKLADEKIPSSFAWGVARVPHPKMALLVRERPL